MLFRPSISHTKFHVPFFFLSFSTLHIFSFFYFSFRTPSLFISFHALFYFLKSFFICSASFFSAFFHVISRSLIYSAFFFFLFFFFFVPFFFPLIFWEHSFIIITLLFVKLTSYHFSPSEFQCQFLSLLPFSCRLLLSSFVQFLFCFLACSVLMYIYLPPL